MISEQMFGLLTLLLHLNRTTLPCRCSVYRVQSIIRKRVLVYTYYILYNIILCQYVFILR